MICCRSKDLEAGYIWQVREHMPAGVTTSMANTATGTNIVFTPHQLVG